MLLVLVHAVFVYPLVPCVQYAVQDKLHGHIEGDCCCFACATAYGQWSDDTSHKFQLFILRYGYVSEWPAVGEIVPRSRVSRYQLGWEVQKVRDDENRSRQDGECCLARPWLSRLYFPVSHGLHFPAAVSARGY